jgi:hypothetical protein
MSKSAKVIFISILFVLLLVGAFWLINSISRKDQGDQEVKTEAEETKVGGDRDEHGCIGSAGYTWCEEKQKCLREWEEPCENEEVFNLLKSLEEKTQIDFSGIVKTEFVWNIEGEKVGRIQEIEEVEVAGKSFDVLKISDSQYQSIETFFKNNGFKVDVYNVSAGTISGSTGYQREAVVCIVAGGASGYKDAKGQWIPPEPDKKDVEVKCGLLGEPKVSRLTLEEMLAEIKDIINWESDDYTGSTLLWLKDGEELKLEAKGFGFGDVMGSSAVDEMHKDIKKYLEENNFEIDADNSKSTRPNEEQVGYVKDSIICKLTIGDYERKASSEVGLACVELE